MILLVACVLLNVNTRQSLAIVHRHNNIETPSQSVLFVLIGFIEPSPCMLLTSTFKVEQV